MPALPCKAPTSAIATADGTNDPRSVRTKTKPVGELSPETTSGIHSVHETTYASAKKLAKWMAVHEGREA